MMHTVRNKTIAAPDNIYQDAPTVRRQHPRGLGVISPYVAEFVGTFLLVLTVGCCSIAGEKTWNVTAIACILMVAIYSVAAVSGGHLNPAVSLALALSGKETWPHTCFYIIVQVLGGLFAAACFATALDASVQVRPLVPFGWWDAVMVELFYTTVLCFVVLNCAGSRRNNRERDQNHFFALAIGFVIIAGGYAGGDISGACFNPAVAMALDITSFVDGVFWGPVYSLFHFVAAAVASVLFFVCRREDFNRPPLSQHELERYVAPLPVKVLSEFLGTFVLVTTVGLNLFTKSSATPWSAAAALMCMIYSLGNVSGGHFNPAVTLAVVLSDRELCEVGEGCWFVLAQLLAGLIGGAFTSHFHEVGFFKDEKFPLAPQTGFDVIQAGVAEFVFTFMLAFVVLAVATVHLPWSRSRTNFHFALAIGASVAAGGTAIGAISGGELNPAVSLGIAIAEFSSRSASSHHWFNLAIFAACELLGGAVAACVLFVTHHTEYEPKDIALTS